MTEPVAIDFLDSRDSERVSGKATFGPRRVDVRLEDGRTMSLGYEHAQVGLGGTANATPIVTLVTEHPHFARLFIRDKAFASHLHPDMPEDVRKRLSKLSGHAKLGRGKYLTLAAGILVTGVVLWQGTFWALDRVVDAAPTSWEIQLGKAIATGEKSGKIQDPVIQDAVDTIGKRLVAQLPKDQPYPFEFHPVWDKVENAYALPGGQVLITSGLLTSAQSPDEVAGILGHEIQHVLGRHTFRRMGRELGLSFLAAMIFGDVGGIAAGGRGLVGLAFDRGQEAESDHVGLALAHKAGFDPAAMAAFFKRHKEEAELDKNAEQVLSLLSTHPADSERIAKIEARARELGPKPAGDAALKARWPEVREHARLTPASKPKK
jgi:Zn-dependent protease with chaperone function